MNNISNVVLVHGWSMHSGMWGPFVDLLGESHRITCLDLPGHGHAPMVEDFNLGSISEVLLGAAPERACWIGWSLGASVVMHIARFFPHRVKSMALLAGNAKFVADDEWPSGMDLTVLHRFAKNLIEDNRGAVLRFLSLQTQASPTSKQLLKELRKRLDSRNAPLESALLGGLSILENADSREVLRNLQCPVLLLFGELDTLVPVDAGTAMKELCPAANLHVVKGAGHMPFYTHASETASIFNRFLTEHCV